MAQDFSVSIDIAEYMRQWAIIPTLSFQEMLVHKFEIGYVLLCWVLERVFSSDRILLLVLSVLILVPFLLTVLLAMTFRKVSVVFLALYAIYGYRSPNGSSWAASCVR